MLSNTTRAIIIGISDYEYIDDLKYSHRDAEAFAEYLKSSAGGNIPEEHIKLLTNKKATAAQIGLAINWLVAESGEGDRGIIYFSGHGDVETESSGLGYLLAHDAQKANYMGSGTILIYALEGVIKNLSEKKKAEVILIADACHSGNLAGSEINGTKATAIALSGEIPKVVKIMSCQPGEVSQESEVWGGGHSVFSYYLIKGLIGFADANENQEVSLREIDGFLYDSVQRSTLSMGFLAQSPMKFGDNNAILARVDPVSFAALRNKSLSGTSMTSSSTERKSASPMDSTTLKLYLQFEEAMKTGHFLYPEQGSAYSIFLEIKERPAIQPQIEMMRFSLAAAMQDDAQKAINDYLSADPREMRSRWNLEISHYQIFPQYLEKAAELLGKDNFMYTQIKAKEYYFTGLNLRLQGERNGGDTLMFKAAISFQEKALGLDSTAAYAYNELGLLARRFYLFEESIVYFKKAVRYSPTWVLPWANMCGSYNDLEQIDEAEKSGIRAIHCDSIFALAHYNIGYTYLMGKKSDLAAFHFKKTIASNPQYANAYYNLGYHYFQKEDYAEAEVWWEKYKLLKPNDPDAMQSLGEVNKIQGKMEQAKDFFLKALELDPGYADACLSVGQTYLILNDINQARKWLNDYTILKTEDPEGYFQLAIAFQQDSNLALQYLKTACQKGFNDYEKLDNEKGFSALRHLPQYNSLVKEYFPEKK